MSRYIACWYFFWIISVVSDAPRYVSADSVTDRRRSFAVGYPLIPALRKAITGRIFSSPDAGETACADKKGKQQVGSGSRRRLGTASGYRLNTECASPRVEASFSSSITPEFWAASAAPFLFGDKKNYVPLFGLALLYKTGSGLYRKRNACLRTAKFWAGAGQCVAHYKFTHFWLRMTNADRRRRDDTWERLHDEYSPRVFNLFLSLRGLYVKIGQVLSSRADFIPRQYVDLFSTLQDDVPARPTKEIMKIIEKSFLKHHNLTLGSVFSEIDERALGVASIGQVHAATLNPSFQTTGDYNGGRSVVVKVKDPHAKQQFIDDFKVFRWLCKIALPGWKSVLVELERQVMTEFDYRHEALSLNLARANLIKSKFAKRVEIPEPIGELCSKDILVMEKLDGIKLAEAIELELASVLAGNRTKAREYLKMKQREIVSGESVNENDSLKILLADENNSLPLIKIMRLTHMARQSRKYLKLLLEVHGHQIFHDGCFNADPHPGNILKLSDGRLGLIDYGQFKILDAADRVAMAKIVVELAKKQRDPRKIADTMREFGFITKFDRDHFLMLTAELYFDTDTVGLKLGFPTPQVYFEYLMKEDPILHIPDAAVMVTRTGFLFRGMGALLQQEIRTSQYWLPFAQDAVRSAPKFP